MGRLKYILAEVISLIVFTILAYFGEYLILIFFGNSNLFIPVIYLIIILILYSIHRHKLITSRVKDAGIGDFFYIFYYLPFGGFIRDMLLVSKKGNRKDVLGKKTKIVLNTATFILGMIISILVTTVTADYFFGANTFWSYAIGISLGTFILIIFLRVFKF